MTSPSVLVACPTDRSEHSLTSDDLRVAYFTEDPPHVQYTCPRCAQQHRLMPPLDILDVLREAGAPSDWPIVPDFPVL